MNLKINLALCLKLMRLETLVESEEKTLELEKELITFEELETKTTCEDKSYYQFHLVKKSDGRKVNHQLVVKIEPKKAIAHYVFGEEDSYSLPSFGEEFSDYQYQTSRIDFLGEFYLEDDILFYEIGTKKQESISDSMGGSRDTIQKVETLKDIDDEEKIVGTLEYGDTIKNNHIYRMK